MRYLRTPCSLSLAMAEWAQNYSCPRADNCISCRTADFIPEYPDCWYIHVAIWMMRSVPFKQVRKTFKVPDLLLFEVASYLVSSWIS